MRTARYRLVVFDLDGTLIDSRKDLADSANELILSLGAAPLSDDRVVGMIGEGARMLVERALRAAGLDETPVDAALDEFLHIYDRRLLLHTRCYPGVPEALRIMAQQAALAVLTNKPAAPSRRLLDELGLSPLLAAVVGGDGPYPRKPSPEGLLALVQTRGVEREDVVLVGDSTVDLETARRAGVACCLVSYGFGFELVSSDARSTACVIDEPAGLAGLVGLVP